MARLITLCALTGPSAVGAASSNMNGLYSVASGGKQDVPFNTDFASKGYEYFDVYSPEIATHYAEVFWTDMGIQQLPKEIVDRFLGKVIAITGYEHDQVMVSPVGQPGVDPDKDVSVPINWAYNHHYELWMVGAHGALRKVSGDQHPDMAHGAKSMMMGMDLPSAALRADPSVPTNQFFSEANGGESRHSYHGYPKGYAQLVDSPATFHVTPMQIDTRNRDCGVTPESIKNCTRFVPGPEPKQSRFGLGIPEGTNYSGLVECPCTSRFGGDPIIYGSDTKTKIVSRQYKALGTGACPAGQVVASAQSCYDGVHTLHILAKEWVNRTVSDPNLPPACSVIEEENGTVFVNYNTFGSSKPCANATTRHGRITSSADVTLDLKLEATPLAARFGRSQGHFCVDAPEKVIKSFAMSASTAHAMQDALHHCEAYCAEDDSCWGCSAHCDQADAWSYGFLERACQFLAVAACEKTDRWAGGVTGDISKYLQESNAGLATITISGPSSAWFGIGFNAQMMCDKPYAIIVNDTGAQEWKLGTCGDEGCHCASQQLSGSLTVVSNTVQGDVRTMVVTRPFQGKTADHYTFDVNTPTLNIITAIGSSEEFGYHAAHAPAVVALAADGSTLCVCDEGLVGQMCEEDGVTGCQTFTKNCVPGGPVTADQTGELLTQRNPTCNSITYVGGLTNCCAHQRIMLDKDQEIRPELLRYHFKIRFWFQEYKAGTPPSHYDLFRPYYQTEQWAGEYDVPPAYRGKDRPMLGYPDLPLGQLSPGTKSCTGQCPDGPDCQCVHEINATWHVSNTRVVWANGHCHAPMCLSLQLYYFDKNDQPVLFCEQIPKMGTGNVTHNKFDEVGYIAIPPCLWGSKDEGLEPSVFLGPNTKMLSVKRCRNSPTMGHSGEMASWQMRAVTFPEPDLFI